MSDLSLYICVILLSIIIFETARLLLHLQKAVDAGKRVIPVTQSLQSAHKRILVIGDSTSFGTGAIKSENSLVGRLARDFPNTEIVND